MDFIHYRQARNSDYLAGVDLEIFEGKGLSNVLTISKVEYKENFMVNGRKKPKGIVVEFIEKYAKPLIINTTNSEFIKERTGVINAVKWVGFTIELYYDLSVSMRKSKTETIKGGIRIKSVNTNGLIAPLKDLKTQIQESKNRKELGVIWSNMSEEQQRTYKDEVSAKTKTF